MTSELHERIRVKIFVGCLLTSDLQYLLNHSHPWKEWMLTQETLSHSLNSPIIQETHFHGKPYLGTFSSEENLTLNQIDQLHQFIKSKFLEFFPSTDVEKLSMHIFPQVFIS